MLLGLLGIGPTELLLVIFMVLGCGAPLVAAIVVAGYYVFRSGQNRDGRSSLDDETRRLRDEIQNFQGKNDKPSS